MFHVGLDRLSTETYGGVPKWEKFVFYGLMFAFLIVLVLGMWFIVGKIGDAVGPLGTATKDSLEIQRANVEITSKLEQIARMLGNEVQVNTNQPASGITPAT